MGWDERNRDRLVVLIVVLIIMAAAFMAVLILFSSDFSMSRRNPLHHLFEKVGADTRNLIGR